MLIKIQRGRMLGHRAPFHASMMLHVLLYATIQSIIPVLFPNRAVAQETEIPKPSKQPKLCTGYQPQFLLTGHLSQVSALSVSSNSKTLVSGDKSGVVKVWDLETGLLLHNLAAYPGSIRSLALSPDGKQIVTVSTDNSRYVSSKASLSIKSWNLKTGQLIRSVDADKNKDQALFDLNKKTVALISKKPQDYDYLVNIDFIDKKTGNLIPPKSVHSTKIGHGSSSIERSRDQTFSVNNFVAEENYSGKYFDLSFIELTKKTPQTKSCVLPKQGTMPQAIFTPDSQVLILAGRKIEVISLMTDHQANSKLNNVLEEQNKNKHLNALGLDKLKRKQYASASTHFWKVFESARQQANWQEQLDAIYRLAETYDAQCKVNDSACDESDYQKLYELIDPYSRSRGELNQELAADRSSDFQKSEKNVISQIEQELYTANGEFTSRQILNQNLALYRSTGDVQGEIEILHALGLSYGSIVRDKQGKPLGRKIPEAVDFFKQALTLSQKTGDRFKESTILQDLGDTYRWGQQYSNALTAYQSSLSIRRQLRDETGEARLVFRVAQIFHALEQYDKALEAYQETLSICRLKEEECLNLLQFPDRVMPDSSVVLQEIGKVYFSLRQYSTALRYFLSATGEKEDYEGSEAYQYIGLIYEKLGDPEKALQAFAKIIEFRGPGCGSGLLSDATLVEAFRKNTLFENDGEECIGSRETWLPSLRVAIFRSAEIYRRRGEYARAIGIYHKALSPHRRLASSLNDLGTLYKSLGQYDQALSSYKEALALRYQDKDVYGEAVSLNNIGEIYRNQGNYSKALESYNQSLGLFRVLITDLELNSAVPFDDEAIYPGAGQVSGITLESNSAKVVPFDDSVAARQGEASVLSNLGSVYYDLGQYDQAQALYQRSLTISTAITDQTTQGRTLNNIGLAYEAQHQYEKSLQAYQQALAVRQSAADLAGEATTLNNIGLVHIKLKQPQQGLEPLQQALAIFQRLEDKASEANTLDSLGTLHTALKDYDRAARHYQDALRLAKAANLTPLERTIYANTGQLLLEMDQPILAIAFFKQSVNLTEGLRQSLGSLPSEQQEVYTQAIAPAYRTLANLLLQQDRILEAQQVLDLLKVQEIDDYLNTVRGNGETVKGVAVLKSELAILQKLNQSQQSAIQLGRELVQLRQIPDHQRSSAQQKRIVQLVALEQELNQSFNLFIESPEVQSALEQLSRTAQRQSVDLADLDALRDNLKQANAVLLYPLILEDRLELVITTPDSAPIRRTVAVSRQDLNQTIVDFRSALQNPRRTDVKPLAQRLYSWLVKPIEADIKQTNAKTIIYAPDGQLRYIPLSALHDGEQWLVQRLRINNITAKSFSNFNLQTQEPLSILAGAFVKGQYKFQVGAKQFAFAGLPFAGQEVSQLVAAIPGTTELIDQNFSVAKFQPRMNDHNVVHLATHSAFVPGQPEDSFILFGNGDRATLRDIGSWSLFNVDLVVLSACETGLGGKLGNGEEILGLGYQFQNRGAKATLASLWQVDDGGTQVLMSTFYRQLKAGNISKAEALRQAQVALITGEDSGVGGDRGNINVVNSKTGQPINGKQTLEHPYYWAPFILIGNGL